MSAPDFDDLAENGCATGLALQHRIPREWIAEQHARNELLKRETTLAPPSGHTGFDLVFRKPPSGIKRLTICHHMLTAQRASNPVREVMVWTSAHASMQLVTDSPISIWSAHFCASASWIFPVRLPDTTSGCGL